MREREMREAEGHVLVNGFVQLHTVQMSHVCESVGADDKERRRQRYESMQKCRRGMKKAYIHCPTV